MEYQRSAACSKINLTREGLEIESAANGPKCCYGVEVGNLEFGC